ncbi:MAG: ATP-binding cassette domain-containing protein [Hyphomicrobiales bacterium]|nr:ATP-binding cassette domain-containing protein [Hyphomicrobiales bacterium]
MALPLALLQVYDRVIPNASYGTVTLLIIGVGIAILLEGFMRFARAHVMGTVGARYEQIAGMAALRHILSSDVSSFEHEGLAVHIERLNSLGALRDYYGGQVLVAMIDIPFIALFVALVFYFGGELGVILGALLIIYVLCAIIFGNRLGKAGDEHQASDESRTDAILGAMSGITTIKAQAMEPIAERRYEMLCLKNEEAGVTVNRRTGYLIDLSFMMSQLAIVAMVCYGGVLVTQGNLSVGGLAACTLLAGRTMQPLGNAVNFWTKFQAIYHSRARFREIFTIPLGAHRLQASNKYGISPETPTKVAGTITIDKMSFRFTDRDSDLLHNINLDVKKGEFIAITGPNGSGKSVLLALLRGFSLPTEGEVRIDDIPVSNWDAEAIDQAVSYLPQKETLFNGTIMENITTFHKDREYQAPAAAKIVGLGGWIQRHPDGYQMQVGSSATEKLPRGIAQRIALARCLVNNPKILLFDDANSAVDQIGDAAVKAVLAKLKGFCTVILVSYRPSILKLADRVFNLENQRLVLVEQNSSEQLTIEGTANG